MKTLAKVSGYFFSLNMSFLAIVQHFSDNDMFQLLPRTYN